MDISLFVISDLHAFDGSIASSHAANNPSFFDVSKPENGSSDNPIRHLLELIEVKKLNSDYLICCGDFGDKAHPKSIERAWRDVNGIKTALNANRLIATVGNHDIDSRYTHNDHDAKGVLLELIPGFPFSDPIENNHFWTHHFTVIKDQASGGRFVVLNSSGYHGEHSETKNQAEYTHGRISDRTRSRLIKNLQTGGKAPFNVLVCHHHPQKHNELNLGDYDDMKGGMDLLSKLDSVEFGPWLVIHGHKHHPKISYAQGGTTTPVVFSAGSCAAVIQPELQNLAKNQVYRIKIAVEFGHHSTTCSGVFESWDWAPGIGWKPAQSGAGLPAFGGFGFHGDLGSLAKNINDLCKGQIRWAEVKLQVPALNHILPCDLSSLLKMLETHYNINTEMGQSGVPILIQNGN